MSNIQSRFGHVIHSGQFKDTREINDFFHTKFVGLEKAITDIKSSAVWSDVFQEVPSASRLRGAPLPQGPQRQEDDIHVSVNALNLQEEDDEESHSVSNRTVRAVANILKFDLHAGQQAGRTSHEHSSSDIELGGLTALALTHPSVLVV